MQRSIALSAVAIALACGSSALAQSSPPPLPQLTPEQSQAVDERLDAYRTQTEQRVTHGEITPDEADRLIAWREWQIAQQVAAVGTAPPSDVPRADPPAPAQRDYVVVQPAPYYGPYYRYRAPYYPPYYAAPRAYYRGPAVCAGGFGRNFGGRICF